MNAKRLALKLRLPGMAWVAGLLAVLAPSVLAHNLDTLATSIHFANDFIGTMSQRASANTSLVRVGDEFWVVVKTTPGPGTKTGLGVMTLWDSHQLRAYGRKDEAPIIDNNGRGNAPCTGTGKELGVYSEF